MSAQKFVVTSSRLYYRDGDTRRKAFRGDVISGLSKADAERFLGLSAIAPKSSDEADAALENPEAPNPAEVSTQPEPSGPPAASDVLAQSNSVSGATVELPPDAATKARWVAAAVESGKFADEAEADKFGTRDELRDELKRRLA